MFHVKFQHAKRVSFATKLFPKTKSAFRLNSAKLKSTDGFDGEVFCGGRSKNRDLLTHFGLVDDSIGCSSFAQLPALRRSVKKLTNLVEQELESIGAHEVLLPTLVPQKLWHYSNRLKRQKDALDSVYKLTDNSKNELLLGPTYEESITKLVAGCDPINESELPLLLYQTSPKFRMEPNPRFGLIRTNEFLMNDLYSFDADISKAMQTYETVSKVYDRIFDKLGLKCVKIESGTGNIGGKYSHEYQLPVSSGEDTIVKCKDCNYAVNSEILRETEKDVTKNSCIKCKSSNIERTRALELGHTFLLSDTYSGPLKAKFTTLDGASRRNFEMGCYGLGLTRIISAGIDLLSIVPSKKSQSCEISFQLRWPEGIEPYQVGIVSPAKRSKQYHGGSTEFTEKLVNRILESTRNLDIIVEDRDKFGIIARVEKLKSLGIPNIVTVGMRFLQDEPEVELLELNSEKQNYEQHWFNSDQLCDYMKRLDDDSVINN